jgi:hypothetical protein
MQPNEQIAQQMAEQEEDGDVVERFLRADDVNLLSLQKRFGRAGWSFELMPPSDCMVSSV